MDKTREVRLDLDELLYLKRLLAKQARAERKRADGYRERGTTGVKPNMFEAALAAAEMAERLAQAFDHNYEQVRRQVVSRISEKLGVWTDKDEARIAELRSLSTKPYGLTADDAEELRDLRRRERAEVDRLREQRRREAAAS